MPTTAASGHALLAQIAASGAPVSQMTPCAACMVPGTMKPGKKCNGCKIAQYCSKECQRTAWPQHKPFCQLVSGTEKSDDAFLLRSGMEPVDVINFVVDMYRVKVSWNERHLGKMAEMLGPKVSPIFHVPGRGIKGDRTREDFERFVRGAVKTGVLPGYLRTEVGIKGCVESAVHEGNADGLVMPVDGEGLCAKYGSVNVNVALLILAERVVGFDAGGPPQGLTIWMDGFAESADARPEVREYVQRIEMERLAKRVADFKSSGPNGSGLPDTLRQYEDSSTTETVGISQED